LGSVTERANLTDFVSSRGLVLPLGPLCWGAIQARRTELPVGIHAAIPVVLEVVWREGPPVGVLLFTLSPFLTAVCAFVGFAEKQLRMLSKMAIFRQSMVGLGLESIAHDHLLPWVCVVSCLRAPMPFGSRETSRI
jgi:hypothetical protein